MHVISTHSCDKGLLTATFQSTYPTTEMTAEAIETSEAVEDSLYIGQVFLHCSTYSKAIISAETALINHYELGGEL